MANLKIKLVKSLSGRNAKHIATANSLGLHKIGNETVQPDNPQTRGKISGTAERPRLSVFRSENNIYAQIIDDVAGKTLCSASTVEKGFEGNGGNCEAAAKIGKLIGERAVAAGITEVVFDRGGNVYHGRVKALAEGAREGGLKF